MIVDDELFNFWFINYRVDRDITRYGIIVNEETEECIVEIYLKQVQVYPIPNKGLFAFSCPYSVLISRRDKIEDLFLKVRTALNSYLYTVRKEKTMIGHMRLWKSLTNNLEEI